MNVVLKNNSNEYYTNFHLCKTSETPVKYGISIVIKNEVVKKNNLLCLRIKIICYFVLLDLLKKTNLNGY